MPRPVAVPLLHPDDHRAIAEWLPLPLPRRDSVKMRNVWSTWIAAHKLGVAHRYVQGRVNRTTLRTYGERLLRAGVIDTLAREDVLGLDWRGIFAVDQHGRVESGRWYGLNPRRRILAKYRAEVESDWLAVAAMLEAAGSNGDGLAMLKPISGLDDLSPAARRYASASARRQGTTAGGAADALAGMGDERRYCQLANFIAARDLSQECLRRAEGSDDVADRLDGWLVRNYVPSRQRRPMMSVPAEWLYHREFLVCGIRGRVVDTADGQLLDLDGETYPIDLLGADGAVPVDQGHCQLVEVMPRIGAACPF